MLENLCCVAVVKSLHALNLSPTVSSWWVSLGPLGGIPVDYMV